MKILIVRMWPDCLNIKSYNCQEIGLAKALIRKGNQCDIVLYTDKETREEDVIFEDGQKIHIYYLRARSFFKNAIYEKKLYEIVKNYDVVQTAEYDQIGNVKLKKAVNGKMVIYHGPYESEFTKGYKKKCLISDFYYLFHPSYKNTPCLAKSELAADLLRKKGFKNVTTVGVGIDTERFEKQIEPCEQIKQLINAKEENNFKYLLYIGKLEERRNILFLLEILKEVVKEDNKIKLIMVGKGDKEYIEKCFKYVHDNNLKDNLIYFESMKQEELPNLYKNCDLFLLPTQYEIFGMVLLEAMYFGVPTITTLNGGSSMLLNEKKELVLGRNKVFEWVKKVNEMVKDNNKEYSEYEIDKIRKYSWSKLCEVFTNEYTKLVKGV